jgi:Uma2 family endonuclease
MLAEAPTTPVTLDEFLQLEGSEQMEWINGQAVEKEPMAFRERVVQNKVGTLLEIAAEDDKHGLVAVESMVDTDSDVTVRGRRPDVFFISHERRAGRSITDEVLDVCPEICVEVVSPHDNAFDLNQKIREYLQAGAELVWQVQPDTREVIVHRADGSAQHVREDEELSGENVLPTFKVPVSRLFPKE